MVGYIAINFIEYIQYEMYFICVIHAITIPLIFYIIHLEIESNDDKEHSAKSRQCGNEKGSVAMEVGTM